MSIDLVKDTTEPLDIETIPDAQLAFTNIEYYFSQLINFQPGNPSVEIQFKELIEYLQRSSWDEVEDDETKEIEVEFNSDTYSELLEAFTRKSMEYMNLMLQYILMDKVPPTQPTPFQNALKTSCLWKVLLIDFAKVSRNAPSVTNSWDQEITNSSNLYDFVPGGIQLGIREYLQEACAKVYKTEEPIVKGMIL
jgi:hypothetical protein